MPPEVEPPEAEAFCVVVVPPDKPNTLRPRSSKPLLNTLFPRSVTVALAHWPRSVKIAIGHHLNRTNRGMRWMLSGTSRLLMGIV